MGVISGAAPAQLTVVGPTLVYITYSGTDRYRLRVWHQATGALVYDTEPGAPDTAAPATPLGGGSIVIH